MRGIRIMLAAFLITFSGARAEIEKHAIPGGPGLQLYWWPRINAVQGWHQDEPYSFHYSVKAFAPDGFTFEDAEAVMYAKASFKPRLPEVRTLDEYIVHEQKTFLEQSPDVVVREEAPLSTADGKSLPTFTFFPRSGTGNWERVCYGEEDEFFLLFAISARSAEGLQEAAAVYERFIAGYRE